MKREGIMEEYEYSDDETLPDLHEKFEVRVKRTNEEFNARMQAFVVWSRSPPESRIYPRTYLNNKYVFRQRVRDFVYDDATGKIYKSVKNRDGICEYI